MSEGPPCPKLPFSVNNGRYLAKEKLGSGCFAAVCSGVDNQQRRSVAIKFEDSRNRQPQLESEYRTLKQIRADAKPQGFAEVFYFGREKHFHCLCMELLGPTLEDRLQSCKGKFSVAASLVIAEQILGRLEFLHSRGIVHRDIKPENFTMGYGDRRHHVYLIDFGLSKLYFDGRHVKEVQRRHLTGTARYASINAHRGVEQSRRDDLEAVGHMLAYFVRGQLPWSGIAAKSREEKYRKIMEKKIAVPVAELLAGYPSFFRVYLEACRSLRFAQRPDYALFRGLLQEARVAAGGPSDLSLPWLDGAVPPASLVPLEAWEPLQQPDDAPPAGDVAPLIRKEKPVTVNLKPTKGAHEDAKTRALSCANVPCVSWVRRGCMSVQA